MRRSLTLIELILSMVIIALTFTVVPKIIQATAKSSEVIKKEDALFNAMAILAEIKDLSWDENNTVYDDILQVNDGNESFDCNISKTVRVGGFEDSRMCINEIYATRVENFGKDDGDTFDDDVDDVEDIESSRICKIDVGDYEYNITVRYVKDPNPLKYPTGNVKFFDAKNVDANSTNTKYISVKVLYKKGYKMYKENKSNCIANFYYHSFNIGYVELKAIPTGWN